MHFEGEPSSSGLTLMLVGHSGQATHQVEVSRDERTGECLRQEVEAPAIRGEPQGNVTLSLWEAGPRVINIPDVTFP